MTVLAPNSPDAETAVIGRCLSGGTKIAGQVVGTLLEPSHFYNPAHRLIYEALYEAYYADEPMDALTIGTLQSKPLGQLWDCPESDAVARVREMADRQSFGGKIEDHARLVKRDSDYRLLLGLSKGIEEAVASEEKSPEEVAGIASQKAMRIATNTLLTHEIVSFGDLGREFIHELRRMKEAHDQGIELGAKFSMRFIDRYTRGLHPTDLWILAGEPGAGKSAVSWVSAMKFAEKQRHKPPEKRIGTFVLSLEMGDIPSKMRIAQTLTGIDSGKMREGDVTSFDLQRITNAWGQQKDLPLYFNFTSTLRASQLRAMIVEAIRRHNVGLVIIDHFRYFDMDRRYEKQIEEDEEKSRFLKEAIAKDLNVAVVCLAHSTKGFENNHDRRPNLSNLRGSGQVAAHADFVSFIYRPFMHATENEKADGDVRETDAEMLWRKNRHGLDGMAPFFFEPARMAIGDSR